MTIQLDLSDSTALVTGAAGDIGRSVAEQLAGFGASLVLADREHGVLDAVASDCQRAGATAVHTAVFDVTDAGAVGTTIDALAADGVIADLVVNNAGYQGDIANTADYEVADFARVLDVNVTGVFAVLRSCGRTLRAAGRPGSIVNMASMAKVGAPNMPAYSASKAAVVALTRTAAKDLADHAIRVNSVSPAFIGPGAMWDRQVELQASVPSRFYGDDPADVAEQMLAQVPLGRHGSLDEVASTIVFLLSDQASYLTGIDIEIAGGAS